MAFDKEFIDQCSKRLIRARMNILANYGFYGLLLSNMIFALDLECPTACTDGKRIWFGPEFMSNLSDSELEFVMMHEIMHIVLQHCLRGEEYDNEIYNIAADIVVNSNILHSVGNKLDKITLKHYGVAMHLTPDGREGYDFTAEEVYEMLLSKAKKKRKNGGGSDNSKSNKGKTSNENRKGNCDISGILEVDETVLKGARFDNHDKWRGLSEEEKKELYEEWTKKVKDATDMITILEASISDGSGAPLGALRLLDKLKGGQLNWRTILTDFLQMEINDYSFSPPDRRMADSDFFLPDFNEMDEQPANVWFLIDTSGSISDKQILQAYSEIANAIEQFNGKIQGLLSFTEVFVTDPVPFSSFNDLLAIKPVGGGGNDFFEIFRYMQKNMKDNLPSYIVIITDGQAAFPEEKEALGVPVLWLIDNDRITPPWGKIARLTSEKK